MSVGVAVALMALAAVTVALLTISLIRVLDGGWQKVYWHRCGRIASWREDICKRCGEQTDDAVIGVARPKWPWGWRYKR